MGRGNHLLSVYNSSHAYQMKRLTAYLPMSIMRYSSSSSSSEGKKFHHGDGEEQHDVREERAPSTAQEFIKVAAEKNIRRGNSPSQRTRDGEEETTTTSDSDSDSDEEEEKVDDILPPPSNIGPTS